MINWFSLFSLCNTMKTFPIYQKFSHLFFKNLFENKNPPKIRGITSTHTWIRTTTSGFGDHYATVNTIRVSRVKCRIELLLVIHSHALLPLSYLHSFGEWNRTTAKSFKDSCTTIIRHQNNKRR
jgi:hypothetical protein